MINRQRHGLYIHLDNWSSLLVIFLVMGPMLGFALGFIGTNVFAGSEKISSALVCGHGFLETTRSSASQKPGQVSFSFTAACLSNGRFQDVTGRMIVINGLISAAGALIIGLLLTGLVWFIQPSGG
jgi:hypothetical protein